MEYSFNRLEWHQSCRIGLNLDLNLDLKLGFELDSMLTLFDEMDWEQSESHHIKSHSLPAWTPWRFCDVIRSYLNDLIFINPI